MEVMDKSRQKGVTMLNRPPLICKKQEKKSVMSVKKMLTLEVASRGASILILILIPYS